MLGAEPKTETVAGGDVSLAAALDYAGRGWPVFPLDGKVPRVPRGFLNATTDVAQIRQWWATWPDAGVAIATGAPSGLFVLDVDGETGADSLHELELEHGELPETVRCKTGGGGEHYYFKHTGGEIRNSAGKLGPGLDVRATGGYVVAPPTVHPSGRRYEWDAAPEDAELAPPTAWLIADATSRRNGTSRVGETIRHGRQHSTLVSLAGTMRKRGLSAAEIDAALQVVNRERCERPAPAENVTRIAESVGTLYEPAPTTAPTDLGNAELLCGLHGHRLRHVRARRHWLVWRDGRWRVDETGEPQRAAKSVSAELVRRAAELEGEDRKAAVKWALASQADGRIQAMLRLAESEPEIALPPTALDADPYLIGVGNGTLDLRTGELRDAAPDDLISLGTEVPFDPDAACPRWERFLLEVFGDQELIGLMRRHAGYCLTGDVLEHVLFVFHGTGRNGKSTYVETAKRLLGDLATTAAFETFVRTRGGHGPRNDLARLHGARLVTASESGAGRRLDEATVKEITGGDTVAARFLYSEHFEFRPQFKLVLVTNNRPRVDGGDDAMWARMRLIPFTECFLGREDPELERTLEAELPGILRWAVEGCLEWQRDGLGTAGAVERATREYREDEDVLGAFLAERCEVGEGETPKRELREAYEDFCRELGEQPLAASHLGRQLTARGIAAKDKPRRVYADVRLAK